MPAPANVFAAPRRNRLAALPLPLLMAVLMAVPMLAACASSTKVEPYKVGSRIAPATLLDQHGVPHKIDESVFVIFFAREMEGGSVIRQMLEEEGPEFLKKHRALYVADISDMPSLIANMVAIPKMKDERPYPTLLDREGEITARFPSEEGRVTILQLHKLEVKGIHYRGSVRGLIQAATPGPPKRTRRR
jgi:hypothetical protein